MEYFDEVADGLRESFPAWWKTGNPASEVSKLIAVWAELVDELAAVIEAVHLDQALATASDEALRSEWAPLYGLSREELPLDTETLRQYLRARMQEDGSIGSLETSLLAILDTPANNTGTVLLFPGDGSGLTFPADGSGLVLFQPSSPTAVYLRFPVDGSGLTFPVDGSGLIFPDPSSSRVEVFEDFADDRLEVFVRSYLAFDRPAFARAVARFRLSHLGPTVITENTEP